MEDVQIYTILVEEKTGTIEYDLIHFDEPDARPIECIGGRNLNTEEEVEPLTFPELMEKLLDSYKNTKWMDE